MTNLNLELCRHGVQNHQLCVDCIVESSDDVTCIGCGCTESAACWDEIVQQPCRWLWIDFNVSVGVCSDCPDHEQRFKNGDREMAVPTNR